MNNSNTCNTPQKVLLGVDTGGTFTDFVVLKITHSGQQLSIHKRLSTPSAPEKAILQGIKELDLMPLAQQGNLLVVHGSTVATNAALEGKGVRTVYITNRGFKDTLTIGRQTRKELYNLQPTQIPPPVPPSLCLETGGRLDADASVLDSLNQQDLEQLVDTIKQLQPKAVAINLLFSFLDDQFEKDIEQAIKQSIPNPPFITRSSFVLPEYKEYERGMATWLNAWLGPLVELYLCKLTDALKPSSVAVMQSSGGTIDSNQACARAVNMLLSGPAGGLAASLYINRSIDSKRILTFDMGGTSTDVALIDKEIQLTNEGKIGDYPVAVPMVDMHTIGAGGGSIATIDTGGLLQVGPQSAGADPGPACYGLGGNLPTVTDANVVLGRLDIDSSLGGSLKLDKTLAINTIKKLANSLSMDTEEAALGIIQIANEHMTHALRVISVQRGYNPSEFRLCSFGGAGGLHVCALAQALKMKQAVVPVHAGVLSAFGMLVAPKERQLSRTSSGLLHQTSNQKIAEIVSQLNEEGQKQLQNEGVDESLIKQQPSLDLRYKGQSYTLTIPWKNNTQAIEDFHQQHNQRYGHQLNLPVELVNVRLALQAHTQPITLPQINKTQQARPIKFITLYGIEQTVAVYDRQHLAFEQTITGPALIVEPVSTTFVAENWIVYNDKLGNLLLEYQK